MNYNVGIVSTSYIGEEFIDAINHNEHVTIKAVYSRHIDTGSEFAKKNNIDIIYTDYNDMLKDEIIDIIYISSPNSFHFEQALKAVRSNKHVIVEKPITLYRTDLEQLYDEAEKRNVLVMEAIVNIHYDSFKLVRNWINEIGDIQYVGFNLQKQTRHFDNYKMGKKINVFSKDMGGGALRDLGPYPIYPLVYLFGEPNSVEYNSIKNVEGIDETTTILCSYKGINASVSASKLVNDNRNSVILGTKGSIAISNINTFENIKKFDNLGNLVGDISVNREVRMIEEVNYFINKLEKSEKIDEEFIENSLTVCSIIEGNYKDMS